MTKLASAICKCRLIWYEMRSNTPSSACDLTKRYPHRHYTVMRNIHDLRVFVFFQNNQNPAQALQMAKEILAMTYPKSMPYKSDFVNPSVGLTILPLHKQIGWSPAIKHFAKEACYAHIRSIKTLQHWEFALSKMLHTASHHVLFTWGGWSYMQMAMVTAEWPWKEIREGHSRMASMHLRTHIRQSLG